MTGGDILIDSLKAQGARAIFGIPGTQNIQVYDALYRRGKGIEHFLVRNEQAAAGMADGFARATGGEGVALVVSGPGAANAAGAMEEAMCDTSPLLLITGHVNTEHLLKRHQSKLFHGLDLQKVFASICKYCDTAMSFGQVPLSVESSFRAMRNGRPGPTLISVPRDILEAEGKARIPLRVARQRQEPDSCDLARAVKIIRGAKRPLILAGGAVSACEACGELRQLAEQMGMPVVVTRRGKGVFPEDHPLAFSNMTAPMGSKVMALADCLISVGVRFTSIDTLMWSIKIPHPHVQLDLEAKEIGCEYPTDAGVVGDLKLTLQSLAVEMKRGGRKEAWKGVLGRIRREVIKEKKVPLLGEIREVLDRNAILAVDINSIGYRSFAEFPCYDPHTFLYPCLGGDLGWAFPAALGAKAAFPERQVVCLIGDGGFLFNATELATAMKYGFNVVTIVVNDKALTSIKGAQQRMCGGRLIDTDLYNPDFVQFAQSFGAFGIRVDDLTSFKHILTIALKQKRPSVIELPMSEKQEELIRGIPWLSRTPAPEPRQPNKE